MEEELTFPIERSPAMKIMAWFYTGSVPGQVLVMALLIIGLVFMADQQFSGISIIFCLVFILPIAIFIHFRLVRKGKKLQTGWCDIKYFTESKILEFKTGFPNTMNPSLQEVEITNVNKDIWIVGGEIGGYHLRLGDGENIKDATRLGLWISLEDAKESAEKLQKLLQGKIFEKIKTEEDNRANKEKEKIQTQ